MKTPRPSLVRRSTAILLLLLASAALVFAQGSRFAYQGRLTEAGNPATGSYEMQFKLFDTVDVGTGTQRGNSVTNSAVAASNGVFTVILDFGAAAFDGSQRFLEISVKRANTANPYSLLTPRQAVAPLPYAVHSLSASQITGDASGNVGIGTTNPAPGVRLEVKGPARVDAGGSGGFVQFGTPNGESGLSISMSNRADLRFDGNTLKLLAGSGVGPPPLENGITINRSGLVGFGEPNPQTRLHVSDPNVSVSARIETGGGVNAWSRLEFANFNGLWSIGTSRDFNGDQFYIARLGGPIGFAVQPNGDAFVAGNLGIGAAPVNKLSVSGKADFAGDVGIGTTAPVARLHAETSQGNKAAVYGKATGPGGVGVVAASDNGPALRADGNATQAADKGGFVKAMIYVGPDGSILRCYNGVDGTSVTSGSSRFGCGISVNSQQKGSAGNFPFAVFYTVTFPFPVADRFVAVAPAPSGAALTAVNVLSGVAHAQSDNSPDTLFLPDPHSVLVRTFFSDDQEGVRTAFHMIVY